MKPRTHATLVPKRANLSGASADLISRLALPQFLLRKGRSALEETAPHAGGLATSLFQDAAEAFLWILAEEGSVNLDASAPFPKLLDAVGAKFPTVLHHKAAISRLNKARVAFKHHQLNVQQENASYFETTIDAFLTEVSNQELGLDFTTASLVSTIGHQRTANWLKEAEKRARQGDIRESLQCSAAALAVFESSLKRGSTRHFRHDLGGPPVAAYMVDAQLGQELAQFAAGMERRFEQIESDVDLLMKGINLNHYTRFRSLVPAVHVSQAGTFHVVWTQEPSRSGEDARFCVDFALDFVLRARNVSTRRRVTLHSGADARTVLVTRSCDLIVYPKQSPHEIIRKVQEGEKLDVVPDRLGSTQPGYVLVWQDDDPAYVRSDCVRILDDSDRDSEAATSSD